MPTLLNRQHERAALDDLLGHDDLAIDGRRRVGRARTPLHAVSAAFEDNAASLGVSRKLGYRDDGIERHLVRGRRALTRRLRLTRADWQATRTVPVQIHGLQPCLPHFGLPAGG
jgi:hypothetical protein